MIKSGVMRASWWTGMAVAGLGLGGWGLNAAEEVQEGHYWVLPADKRTPPPFEVVNFRLGPRTTLHGTPARWWQLEAREKSHSPEPIFQVRGLTTQDPLEAGGTRLEFLRYQLRVPADDEILEYRSMQTGHAQLPGWKDFVRHFLPRPARGTRRQGDFPETCAYLGHVLSLQEVRSGRNWPEWDKATVLNLDDELLIGTGRVFKDAEGHRLPQTPQRQNYTYAQFTREDYGTMIQAGLNSFGLVPGIESYLRTQPVFYRRDDRGDRPLQYPADFYRSNFRGNLMFEDEPACIMVGEEPVQTRLRHFTDAVALLNCRVRARHDRSAHSLEKALRDRGVSFGAMRLAQTDYAVWETRYETAFYQLEAGFAGFVHEGRYNLTNFYESGFSFDDYVRASTGLERTHTAEEMLRIHFAFLRGAARHFNKDWGTSIYGQADPAITPLAVRLAYDMGARYVWYWTSDHGHHLPWVEQLQLTRLLRDHAAQHPRPSIRGPRPVLDRVIVIPYGTLLVLESPLQRKHAWDLWWVRDLDPAGQNAASARYRSLMRQAFTSIHQALDAGEDFDVAVDDGREFQGYKQVIRVNGD